jgi:hypothetical protein
MRTLYIGYATWKSVVQAQGLAVYEKIRETDIRQVWAGSRDVVYQTDVTVAEFADYDAAFPTRTEVPDEDEALAQIISFTTVLEPRNQDGTPIVAERLLTLGQDSFRRTDDGTEQMNIDGTSGGNTVIVWNGTGAADTGGDWTREGEGTESAAADRGAGTNGLDTGGMSKNDEVAFAFGSNQDVASTYDVFRFWMKPVAYPSGSKPTLQWRNTAGDNKGVQITLTNYVTNMDLGVWQQVEIPMSDFNLGSDLVDRIVLRFEKKDGQRFHFDDVDLGTASGGDGPYTFQLAAPDALTRYHVSMLVFVVSGPSSGWTSGSFANIPALPNGLLLRQRNLVTGEVLWHFNSKDNADLFGRYHPQDDVEFADSTMLVGFMVKPGKSSIAVTDEWVLEFVVRDDLGALAQARAFAHFGVEDLA